MTYILLFTGIGIAGIILALLVFARAQQTPQEQKQQPAPKPTVFQNQKKNRVTISDVTMLNPLENPVKRTQEGDVVFASETAYQLLYLPTFNQFLITILTPSFETGRKQAEQALLDNLGISEQDACLLNVDMGTPASINPTEAGKRYPLSFCQ